VPRINESQGRFLTLAAIVLFGASLPAAGRESFTVKTPGPWVQISALDDAGQTAKPAAGISTLLLDDHQTRVTGRSVERYVRHARLVASQKDLKDFSEIQIEFEPSYQTLTLHHIQIRRGGSVTNALHPEEIKLLHREQELEQQIFNGSVQALAILSDVRVGDIVDFAYTVDGDNPVMGGRFDDLVDLSPESFVKHLRYRLLWPQKRKLLMRSHNTDLEPKITVAGDETEYVWEGRDTMPFEGDDRTPSWYFAGSWVDERIRNLGPCR
jgi:hypothetical protein